MPSFGKRVDGVRGRRASSRQAVVLGASALSLLRSRSVIVADIAPEGAKLLGRDLPSAGAEVLIRLGSRDTFATVVWNNDDRCGVRFDEAFSNDVLAAATRESRWAAVTGCIAP